MFNSSILICSFAQGRKYNPIVPFWLNQVQKTNPGVKTRVFRKPWWRWVRKSQYAWWDVARLQLFLSFQEKQKDCTVVYSDLDVIYRKSIAPLLELPADLLISTEIGGKQAFPKEISAQFGFGVCSRFYAIKPKAHPFMQRLLHLMKSQHFGVCSDQVTLMHYLWESQVKPESQSWTLDGKSYTNHFFSIDGIRICVIDFALIVRDPILDQGQLADHINIDNVGGTKAFLRYFQEPLESLPLTCRCGKLGNTDDCPHASLRMSRTHS